MNGLLVNHIREWPDKLLELCELDTRLRMSAAARAKALEFTIEGNAHLWEKAYGGDDDAS